MRLPVRAVLLVATAALQGGQTAACQSHAVIDVTYYSGATRIAASVLIPEGEAPFPAVVLVQGSGSSDRSNPWTSAYASALVDRGIVVLHPDKRGSGESTGNWRTASFADLAADAVAGVAQLSSMPMVDSTRVGLIGFSQGGQVVPLAASLSLEVDFVVNISGSVVPILEQIGDEVLLMARGEGFTEEQLNLVARIHERGLAYIKGGAAEWDAYWQVLQSAGSLGIGHSKAVSGFPTDPDSPAWAFLRTIAGYDPLPVWERLRIPALFVFGGRDANVDVFKSSAVIENTLSRSGLPYSLLLFRNNGHALYRDDALAFLAAWIHSGGDG